MTFLNPLFLLGLLSASIPVIIHLIYRRRARVVPFSSLFFLRMIDQRVAKRQKLKELLLLMVRILVFTAVALALAKPMIKSGVLGALPIGQHVQTSAVLLMDDSYSMAHTRSGVSSFSRAKEAAAQTLDTLGIEDSAAVMFTSNDPVLERSEGSVEANLSTDLASLREKILNSTVSNETARIIESIERAIKILEDSKDPNREIYVFTDMQENCWYGEASEELLKSIKDDASLFIVDVGEEVSANLGITSVDLGKRAKVIGVPFEISATVRNYGRKRAKGKLALYIGDTKVSEKQIALAGGASVHVGFARSFDETGTFSGYVGLDNDELSPDNRRCFFVDVRDKIEVLIVNGDPSEISYLDEAFYLSAALSPLSWANHGNPTETDFTSKGRALMNVGPKSIIHPTVVPIQQFSATRSGALTRQELYNYLLEKYQVIILANVSQLGNKELTALEQYVEEGGGIIFFLGDKISPIFYNGKFCGLSREHGGLLPARVRGIWQASAEKSGKPAGDTQRDGYVTLSEVNSKHPIFRGMGDDVDLSIAHFYGAWEVEPVAFTPGRGAQPKEGAEALARFSNRLPALLEKSYGRGKVLLFTSTCDLDWNNFAVKPSYLPLLHQIIYYLTSAEAESDSVQVGVPKRFDFSSNDAPVDVLIADPLGGAEKIVSVVSSSPLRDSNTAIYDKTLIPGVYSAVYNLDGETKEEFFVVNVDPSESAMTRIEQKEIRRLFPVKGLRVVRGVKRLAQAIRRKREGVQLWDYLFYVAVALVLFECYFSNARRSS